MAEDHDEMRAMICAVLLNDGYAVQSFSNGRELLEALVQRFEVEGVPPDLVITDIRMPGCSGLEILARLRRYDAITPVILVTAFGDSETHTEAERLGADYLLDKPFDLEDLRFAVLSCVAL